jgi:hypothetical protein
MLQVLRREVPLFEEKCTSSHMREQDANPLICKSFLVLFCKKELLS